MGKNKSEEIKQSNSINDKALALIDSFQSGDLINPELELLGVEGIEQLTIPVVKFEKEGQVLIGIYLGCKECPSTYKDIGSDYFLFHRIMNEKKRELGFCGSMAIDQALKNKDPYRYLVFIKFKGKKKVSQGGFKQFDIMAIDMQNKSNPLYQLENHPFVKIYKELFDVTIINTNGDKQSDQEKY